jgi:plastocyanin domain-containing protein
MKLTVIIRSLATAGLFLGVLSGGAIAQESPALHEGMSHTSTPSGKFEAVSQPLWLKAAVTAGGLSLIGLELWWFLLSKPKSQRASIQGDIQEVTENGEFEG